MTRTSTKKQPKYVILAAEIQSQIESGVLRSGDRLPTILEMCAKYDVTPTTITNVYSLLKKEKLIICERGQGTFVASPPSKAKTGIIGISGLVSNTMNSCPKSPYLTSLLHGITHTAAKYDLEVLLLKDTHSRQWDQIDGVIAHGYNAPALVQQLPAAMPKVLLNHTLPDMPCVVADERAGIASLVNHLLRQGHQRIAALLDTYSPLRMSAYREALHLHDIEPRKEWLRQFRGRVESERPYFDAGLQFMTQWLQEDWEDIGCTAIVTQNDETAQGVIEALHKAGKKIPSDVSITGFDGAQENSYAKPFLTTIELPFEDIGIAAVESLQKQLTGVPVQPGTLVLPVKLRVGDTTASL